MFSIKTPKSCLEAKSSVRLGRERFLKKQASSGCFREHSAFARRPQLLPGGGTEPSQPSWVEGPIVPIRPCTAVLTAMSKSRSPEMASKLPTFFQDTGKGGDSGWHPADPPRGCHRGQWHLGAQKSRRGDIHVASRLHPAVSGAWSSVETQGIQVPASILLHGRLWASANMLRPHDCSARGSRWWPAGTQGTLCPARPAWLPAHLLRL